MGMTATQKILAKKAGKPAVCAEELIEIDPDIILGNDITSPVAITEFKKINADKVRNSDRIVLVMDHFTPNKDIKSAENCKIAREFSKKYGIRNFFDTGKAGIEHALLPEAGLVCAGDAVVGADSHTCTYGALGAFSTGVGSTDMAAAMYNGKVWIKVPKAYKIVLKGKPSKYVSGKDIILTIIGGLGVDGAVYKSLEFAGDGISYLTMDDRFCIANMAVECGAKNAFFPVDKETRAYLKEHCQKTPEEYFPDSDAEYEKIIEIELSKLHPTVALPPLPSNIELAENVKNLKIDQVVIGSCTNGRYSDLEITAKVLKGHKVAPDVRLIVIPATQKIYLECIKSGIAETVINAGGVFSTPTCGPCLGGHMGILAAGERAISTTNRNFVGRMGDPKSEIVLASPLVAAYAAISGEVYFNENEVL